MRRIYFVFCLLIIVLPVQAQIYKWTDSSGNVHFSDKPHPGSEKIELPSVQTYSSPVIPTSNAAPPITSEANSYEKVTIVQPEDQVTIRNTEGYVSVVCEVEPSLKSEDKVQLLFDGSVLGSPQSALVFALKSIDRGSHTIAVQVVDSEGKVLATSAATTIFMQPPRINMGKNAP